MKPIYSLLRNLLKNKKSLSLHLLNRQNIFDILPIDSNSIVFVGDSHTQSFEVAELFKDFHVKNRGINGDRTETLLNRLEQITSKTPKKIFLQIGINDLSRGYTAENTFNNIKLIIRIIQENSPNTMLYVQSIFPMKNYSPSILCINEKCKNFCNENHIEWINIYDSLVFENGLNQIYDCGDGLHLNGKGYLKWKSILDPYIYESYIL